jgi:NAD-dependent dihydropyrimidine dehydrogenase PreA subunit
MAEGPTLLALLREHWHLARTLRRLEIRLYPERCSGVWECVEVCPVDCWSPNRERNVVRLNHPENCIACGACVLQCPEKAIALEVPHA